MKNKIILIGLLFAFNLAFSQVPDTETFTLQNVVDVVNPTTDDLVDCISDADAALYDPTYYTSPATSLLEFRNYGYVEGYGFLYNAYAVNYAYFAPTDWKVPTKEEWRTLINSFGGKTIAGNRMKEAGTDHWNDALGINTSGFTALGAGGRETSFSALKEQGTFYTSSTTTNGNYLVELYSSSAIVNDYAWRESKTYGYSVRLLYTGSGTPTCVEDYDGNTYSVVKIGDQYWTAENWACTRMNNGVSITNVTSQTTWNAASTGKYYRCSYDNNTHYSSRDDETPCQDGILSTPNNKTWTEGQFTSAYSQVFVITVVPDVNFAVTKYWDTDKFSVTTNYTNNTITVYPLYRNTSAADYELTIQLTYAGYDTEVIVIRQTN